MCRLKNVPRELQKNILRFGGKNAFSTINEILILYRQQR